MKCPHCLVDFHDSSVFSYLGADADGECGIARVTCAACKKFVLFLLRGAGTYSRASTVSGLQNVYSTDMFYPKGSMRPPVPSSVPADIGGDYREACLVLPDSAKASAALSRRCLQHLLRTAAGVKPADLANEIQEVLDSGKLPTQLAESIDAIRNIGNFSAHPMKAKATGEILPVEPHEAEWTLDVLESLFDFYYVQPALIATKRAALNAKLASAGKPPLKT